MNIDSLLDKIESYDVVARVNIASSFRIALRAVLDEVEVKQLRREIKHSGVAYRILWRAIELTRQAPDVRYENPYDTALLAYLFVLLEHDPHLALIAASATSEVPNLWWSAELAVAILEDRVRRNHDAGVARLQVSSSLDPSRVALEVPSLHDATDRVFIADVRETVLGARLVEFVASSTAPAASQFVLMQDGDLAGEWRGNADDTLDCDFPFGADT